jgi:calcineurin-like phosphoesterase family protein
MADRYFISDTHFGHDAVYKFTNFDGSRVRDFANSAEEGDQVMIDRWNSVVKPSDKVYHLGDVAFPRRKLAILGQLNGKKILIKGNHDIFDLKDYTKYFVDIRGAHELYKMMLTHIPIHPEQLGRFDANIHGHIHDRKIDDKRYVNVSVEQINATPISLDEVLYRRENG